MEENKNEITEAPEVSEASKDKKKVKSFKMNEAQVDRVNDLLKQVKGTTDADKLIESLELAMRQSNMPELPDSLVKMHAGDREKIATAIHMVHTTFESLMLSTSEKLSAVRSEIEAAHKAEVSKLIAKQEESEVRIKALQEVAAESEDDCKAAQANEVAMKQKIEAISEDMNLKNKVIEGLTKQLEEYKNEMAQLKAETKTTIAKKDAEIAELATDSRKYKEKIEALEAKNEDLMEKSNQGQQENQALTGQLSITELNYKNEQAKNEDLKARISQLQSELTQERTNSSQIQLQFMQLMSSKEKTAPAETKPSNNPPKKFRLENERGKMTWEGNKAELIKHANHFQKNVKVTGSTDISVIEEIFAPLILKY